MHAPLRQRYQPLVRAVFADCDTQLHQLVTKRTIQIRNLCPKPQTIRHEYRYGVYWI